MDNIFTNFSESRHGFRKMIPVIPVQRTKHPSDFNIKSPQQNHFLVRKEIDTDNLEECSSTCN